MDDDKGNAARTARWEERMEVPLGIASGLFLAGYAVHVLARQPSGVVDVSLIVVFASWALFLVDYAVRWRLSGLGLSFVHKHLLDTVVVVLPLLRPVRIVKVYDRQLRRHGEPRLSLYGRVIVYSGLSTSLLGFTGALAVYQQERGAPGTTMKTFGDAVWWACATLTTVGYGDVTPVTPGGRTIAVGMMACGLALLGAVTGSFSSWMIEIFSRGEGQKPPEDTKPPGS
ncbi:potassium channel family protein [Streptomyces mangrovisoli]|uniref:Ion transporter n=1 Tax=Streptomyces mangrovisoli TaxID=1428628 RepID=A0A1J4NYV2_9ACTN|nr:potassium channel family protein [Streptomyces mangrovisoli]OIJ66660.1 ion transporter [Streptomyces mangrovisoli]